MDYLKGASARSPPLERGKGRQATLSIPQQCFHSQASRQTSSPGTFKAVLNSRASRWAAGCSRATTILSRLPESAACRDFSRSYKNVPPPTQQRNRHEGEGLSCVRRFGNLWLVLLSDLSTRLPSLTHAGFSQGTGAGLSCYCCTQVFQGGLSPSPTAPGKSEWAHLLGALLEGSRDELPLLSAPIGQHVHDGIVVHT